MSDVSRVKEFNVFFPLDIPGFYMGDPPNETNCERRYSKWKYKRLL